jgi:hypothetical protein
VKQTGSRIEIAVAAGDRQAADTVVVLDLDGPASAVPAVEVPGPPKK